MFPVQMLSVPFKMFSLPVQMLLQPVQMLLHPVQMLLQPVQMFVHPIQMFVRPVQMFVFPVQMFRTKMSRGRNLVLKNVIIYSILLFFTINRWLMVDFVKVPNSNYRFMIASPFQSAAIKRRLH